VSRAIGTLQIKDTTANYEWASSATEISRSNAIGTDNLRASLDVTYTLSGRQLAAAQTPQGYTQTREEVQWLEMDFPASDDVIDEEAFKVKFKFAAGVSAQLVDIRFGMMTTNNSYKDGSYDDAEHQGWFNNPGWIDNFQTNRVDLISEGTPRNTGGNPPNNALRATSANVTETLISALP